MIEKSPPKETWASLLERHAPLQLPAAHDALTARLIQRAGFHAYQIGGFALVGAPHAFPDVDLTRFAEQSAGVRDIVAACDLPVLVDADDGYSDAKNVTHTVAAYEAMGVWAIFIEDQVSPKRCGHMSGKHIVPANVMVQRIEAAVSARRSSDFFIVARTDALAVEGVDAALKRELIRTRLNRKYPTINPWHGSSNSRRDSNDLEGRWQEPTPTRHAKTRASLTAFERPRRRSFRHRRTVRQTAWVVSRRSCVKPRSIFVNRNERHCRCRGASCGSDRHPIAAPQG